MNFKFLCSFLLIIFAALVYGSPLKSTVDSEEVSIIELEEACVIQGGICMKIEDCDPGSLVQIRGVLCPLQRHLNVECCYMK